MSERNGETGIRTTASWRPMGFGDGDPGAILDPVFEPRWSGRRVLVEVADGTVSVRDADIGEQPRSSELRAAIAGACGAAEAVLDGYLVPGGLPGADVSSVRGAASAGITGGGVARHMLLGSLIRSRPARGPDPNTQATAPLPPDGPLAFAAVDLLWLDGEPLLDLPLGERKRLLEAIVTDGELVRRTASVRAPADRWQGQWRALGFTEMAIKASNSRYVPGGLSRDWAVVPIPRP